jgi:hypothetical protein
MAKLKSKRVLSRYGLILCPFGEMVQNNLAILLEQSVGLLEIGFLT